MRTLTIIVSLLMSLTSLRAQKYVEIRNVQDEIPVSPNPDIYDFKASESVTFWPGVTYSPQASGEMLRGRIDPTLEDLSNENGKFLSTQVDIANLSINKDLSTGGINTTFDVSSGGGYSEKIPIELPRGVGKVIPELHLVYNSQAGNGMAGWGWNLSGISSISRGNNDFNTPNYQYVGSVDYSSDDQYYFNGNLLIPLSGNLGQNGTTYLTETTDFSRITSLGVAGAGPEKFELLSKGGSKAEFGFSADSRLIYGSRQDISKWFINQTIDPNGNTVNYEYTSLSGDVNTLLPSRISYGGNINTSQSDFIEVIFVYATRIDISEGYTHAGDYVSSSSILSSIKVYVKGELFREYNLTYFEGDYSYLQKVEVHSADGEKVNPVIYNYNINDNYIFLRTMHSNHGQVNNIQVGDFNSDGATDYITYNNDAGNREYKCFISSGSGTFSFNQYSTGSLPTGFQNLYLGDFNGDSFLDFSVLHVEVVSGRPYYHLDYHINDGSGFVKYEPHPFNWEVPGKLTVGDYDGNGTSDIIFAPILIPDEENELMEISYTEEYLVVLLTQMGPDPTQTFNQRVSIERLTIPFGEYVEDISSLSTADWDGDGKSDIVLTGERKPPNAGDRYMKVISKQKPTSGSPLGFKYLMNDLNLAFAPHNPYYAALYPDFNGDRKVDAIRDIGSFFNTYVGDGLSNLSFKYQIHYPTSGFVQSVADFNKDGKSDVLIIWDNSGLLAFTLQLSCGCDGVDFTASTVTTSMAYPGYNDLEGKVSIGDFSGDGYLDILIANSDVNNSLELFIGGGDFSLASQRAITKTMDSHGVIKEVTYKPMSSPMIYTKSTGSIAEYPLREYISNTGLVQQVIVKDNSGTTVSNTTYEYADATLNARLRKYLGFREFVKKDLTQNTQVTQHFRFLDDKYPYLWKTELVSLQDATPISTSESDYSLVPFKGVSNYLQLDLSRNTDHLQNIISETHYQSYDTDGNALSLLEKHGSKLDVTTAFTYTSKSGSWLNNKIKTESISRLRQGESPYQTLTEYYYEDPAGNLTKTEKFKNLSKTVTSQQVYDPFGNVSQNYLLIGQDIVSVINYNYDATNRFPKEITNALNQSIYYEYNDVIGKPIKETDANGLIARHEYDGWGRLVKTKHPNGNEVFMEYGFDQSTNPGNRLFFTKKSGDGLPEEISYSDEFGHEVETRRQYFGSWKVKFTEYDYKGRVQRESDEHYEGQAINWTNYEFDQFNRLKNKNNLYSDVDYLYNNRSTSVTDQINNVTSTGTVDETENIIINSSSNGNLIYTYTSLGKISTATNIDGEQTTVTYDAYGNQDKLIDPSGGTVDFDYDEIGRLKSKQDANGRTITYTYDAINRMLSESGPDGLTSYSYDTAPNGIGKLASVTKGNHSEQYEYDQLGRVIKITESLEGEDYVFENEYNELGQLKRKTFPSGISLVYKYDGEGNLVEVQRGSDESLIWRMEEVHQSGGVSRYRLGNNLQGTTQYNEAGLPEHIQIGSVFHYSFEWDMDNASLFKRKDMILNLEESFEYDNEDRLTKSQVLGLAAVGVSYHPNGNINIKSDVGTYSYGGNPYAVEFVTNPQGLIRGTTQSVVYNSYHKPSQITEGDFELNCTYGIAGEMTARELLEHGSIVATRKYIGGRAYVIEEDQNGNEVIYHRVSLNGSLAAVIKLSEGEETTYYLHSDYLGSLLAVSDESGQIVERLSYDAWGNRRNPNDWSYTNIPQSHLFDIGFTGHEHLDEFALVHMGSRLYDPSIAQFISPDRIIHNSQFDQSYNRYAYAYNNPLKYIDPSGDLPIMAMLLGGFANAIAQSFDGGYNNPGEFFAAFLQGAVMGFNGAAAGASYSQIYGNTFLEGLPEIKFWVADDVEIRIKTRGFLGTDQIGGGIDLYAKIGQGDVYIEGGLGLAHYDRNYGPSLPSNEFRYSFGMTYDDGNFRLGAGSTTIKTKAVSDPGTGTQLNTSQRIGRVKFGIEDFNVMYQNDHIDKWEILGDGGDRYRTTAARISYKQFSKGINLYTGEPSLDEWGNRETFPHPDAGEKGAYKENISYRYGIDYYQVGIFRLGRNAESVRNYWQNHKAHGDGDRFPIFPVLNSEVKSYFQAGSYDQFLLW